MGTFIAADGCHDTSGAVAGGQVGYRWHSSSWVFGMEAQGDWADLRGSSVSIINPANINRSRMDAFGLFTGQVGYAWNTALLYLKGGVAVVADRNDVLSGGVVAATSSGDNRWGGTVGGGLEYSFAPNWSAAVEYDHLFIANNNTNFTVPPGLVAFGSDRLRGDADLVTVRVNYRWGGPVVATYDRSLSQIGIEKRPAPRWPFDLGSGWTAPVNVLKFQRRRGLNEMKNAGDNKMKKFWLGTVGLVALGVAAPAFAADLPAQSYSKAPATSPCL